MRWPWLRLTDSEQQAYRKHKVGQDCIVPGLDGPFGPGTVLLDCLDQPSCQSDNPWHLSAAGCLFQLRPGVLGTDVLNQFGTTINLSCCLGTLSGFLFEERLWTIAFGEPSGKCML